MERRRLTCGFVFGEQEGVTLGGGSHFDAMAFCEVGESFLATICTVLLFISSCRGVSVDMLAKGVKRGKSQGACAFATSFALSRASSHSLPNGTTRLVNVFKKV